MELALFSDTLRPNSVTIDQNGSSTGSSSMTVTPTRSTTDLPNRVGNTARREDGELLYNEIVEENGCPRRRPSEFQQQHSQQRKQWWESNYKEAAIFLEVVKSEETKFDFSKHLFLFLCFCRKARITISLATIHAVTTICLPIC